MCFLEDLDQLKQYWAGIDSMPTVKLIILWEKIPEEYINNTKGIKFINIHDLCKLGETKHPELDNKISKLKPSSICSILYTSGTTGMPKGCMYTHDALWYSGRSGAMVNIRNLSGKYSYTIKQAEELISNFKT